MKFSLTAKSLAAFFVVGLAGAAAQITADGAATVMFGDDVAAVAKRLDEKVYDIDRGRPGVDKQIGTATTSLVFDTDRLCRMTLKPTHLLRPPLRAFAEEWKNFAPLGDRKLAPRMSRENFMAYLGLWRQAAEGMGKKENVDFWISETGTVTSGGRVTITLAPRRRLMGTGELIGDTWVVSFTGAVDAKYDASVRVASLDEIVITCDRFNTQRRETEADRGFTPALRTNGRPLAGPTERGGTLTLDDGRRIVAGMTLDEATGSLQEWWRDDPRPYARIGIDRWISTYAATLEFDADRLKGVSFGPLHEFKHAIQCFDEDWKNPDPIDGLQLKRGLTRRELHAYLEAWRKRATAAGKRPGRDFWIRDREDEETVSVILGPRRLAPGGMDYWSDIWIAQFDEDKDATGGLTDFSVTLDAFDTVGRLRAGVSDPVLAGVTLEDGTELYFGQDRSEVERLLGVTASNPFRPANAFATESRLRVSLRSVDVEFDNDRLHRISFRKFSAAPAPFPERWKNLTPIDELRVEPAMSREKFAEYLAAWETRLQQLGFVRDKNYRVEEFKSERLDSVMIRLPASRISVGGSNWPDTWSATFNESGPATNRRWQLVTIDAVRGEYNSRPPSPATQRRRDVQEIIKSAPVIEPPPIELVLPKE